MPSSSPAKPLIEFRVAGFTPSNNAYENTVKLLEHAKEAVGVLPSEVKRLIIADDQNYGPAIRELSPKEGYTNDGIYRGVAKILPEYADGLYSGCSFVLHHCVIGSFFAHPDSDRPVGEIEAMKYSFFHEFGHCIDYRRRPYQHHAKVVVVESPVQQCARRNSASFFAEYAACFHSAKCLELNAYRYLVRTGRENMDAYLADLTQKRARYQTRLSPLHTVKNAALVGFWRGLIEYGKLLAFLHAIPELGPPPEWPAHNDRTNSLLTRLATDLQTAWSTYPDCDEQFRISVSGTWFALTKASGYHFEPTTNGDYLWLS